MKTLVKTCFISSLVLLSACKHSQETTQTEEPAEPVSQAQNPNKFALGVGESIEFGSYKLSFMELAGDSRCPKGLECVQMGKAQVVLLLSTGDEAQTLTLDTARNNRKQELGYSVELLNVLPYPKEGYFIDKKDVLVELKATELTVKDYTIIDVRSADEYGEGNYPNSVNIIHDQIGEEIAKLNLNKSTPIALYCRSGRRAGWAEQILEELGYTHVVNGINQSNMHLKLGTADKF